MIKILFLTCSLLAVFSPALAQAGSLSLKSSDLTQGGIMAEAQVFNGFGCSGQNISPEISWSGAPEGTKYFAVTAYDPDAPTGSGWWHWVVVNIPADVTSIARGGPVPEGAIETMTDFGKTGYGGACPPVGDKPHHYHFTVYALKDKVPVDPSASGAMAGYYIQSLKLDSAEIVVTYGREKK